MDTLSLPVNGARSFSLRVPGAARSVSFEPQWGGLLGRFAAAVNE